VAVLVASFTAAVLVFAAIALSEGRIPRRRLLTMLGADLLVSQPQVAALLGWLGFINVLLGVFNLIPGFPMDGGRVLRAILWRLRGDRLVATRSAALVGRAFAYLLIGLGVFMALRPGGSIFSGLWLALIGWFLSNAAEATIAQAGVERSLRGVRVRDAMDDNPPSVSPNEPVSDLVQERMLRGEDRSFLVRHDDGGLAGMVTLGDVRRLPRDDWPDARVTDIMTRFNDLATIGPDAPLVDALRLIQEKEIGQLPVIDGDERSPVGIVTRRGILRLIEARMKLGM
jgi:CBS domain-containing protein